MANEIAGSPVTRLPWAGKQVRIEEVDTTLSSLWKMSADNMRIGANLNVRTSVLNLLICTPDSQSALYASKLLRDLSSTHIARATLVVLDQRPEAPDALESWVTLRCFSMISDMMRHCFEQTTLLASGRATLALPRTLPMVLNNRLPVYLWWIGDTRGANDTIFRDIAELCERVIVDSTTFFQPEQDIHTLANYCKAAPQTALSDLNWGRLTLWRQLVAEFFDGPEYLPFLSGIERIEIEHAAAPLATANRAETGEVSPNPTAALLLAGWLKASLNMELAPGATSTPQNTGGGTYEWSLNLPLGSQPTLMQIRPRVQAGLLPGSLCLVRLTCKSENQRVIFTIKREATSAHVETSVESAERTRPVRAVNLPDRHKESELLHNEMEITVHDQHFEQALHELELLLGGDKQ
jgi:glucose-6-phosphate dehydrogenase assembly protein OpcA